MLGRSMLAYLPVNLANIVVSFGTIVVLTRLLGSAEFGRYAIAMITVQFVHMGIFTWMEAAMARFQARAERENDVRSHLKTLYTLGAITGLIGGITLISVVFLLPLSPQMTTVLAVALGSTALQIIFNLGMEAHKAAHRVKRYSFTYSGQTLLSFTLGILLVLFTPLREVAPFVGILLGLICFIAIDLTFMLTRMRGGTYQADKTKIYFAYGMPICLSLLLTYALNSADVYIIAAILGEASAGQYNAGYNLANRSLEILFIWIAMAVTPMAVTAFEKQGSAQSIEIMKTYGASLLWIALPAATGIALVSQDAGFILGESVRAEAVTVMPLIAFAGMINGFMNYYVQRAFMLSGKTGAFAWAMVPPVLLNIGLNLWLIPQFGLMGAVYATVISYALGLIIAIVMARRSYPLPLPMRATLEIAAACAVMWLAVSALPIPEAWHGPISLLIKASVGAGVYLTVCWLINAANCRNIIRDVWQKFRRPKLAEVAE
ncbi:lipopolysaccharide biosynthesis protein [Litorimonas sp. RW-G-Af-16]|uniref:lipopolysaccharide biosynthesis protein n=1 Tax=Litorimonas sp. RW-G-Af-16 TaxID=3241168 RepID=UPI00390C7134